MSDRHDADYLNHLAGWEGFVRFTKAGILVVVVILVGIALFLV